MENGIPVSGDFSPAPGVCELISIACHSSEHIAGGGVMALEGRVS